MQTLLRKLGIDRRNLRALPLLPLVEVAWADGEIQAAELVLIHRKAVDLDLGTDEQDLLDSWLGYPPSPEYLRAGRLALGWFRRKGDPGLDPEVLRSLIGDARQVARAHGGWWFGFGAISRVERQILSRLAVEIESPVDHGFAPPEGHPDFLRKSNPVTLAYSAIPGTDEGDAVLQPLFDRPCRLALREHETWIGAGDDADVRIVDDPEVRPSHCMIDKTPSGYVARALDGAMWLNGERVRERRLLGGETIRISAAASFVFKLVRGWDDARTA